MLILLHRAPRICILRRRNPQWTYGLWRGVQCTHAENLLQDHIEVPGLFPSHKITSKPSCVHWGRRSDGVDPVEDVPHILYHEINGEMMREEDLKTKGSGSPSRVDAKDFRRMLACKSFKIASAGLCDAIAVLAKRLYTGFIDPLTIEPILANRPIPLDKGNGEVQPIGVGDGIRKIIGKCMTKVTKQNIVDA